MYNIGIEIKLEIDWCVMKIHERLTMLRKERGYLQKDVADILNISKSAYGYYEQGRNEPDIQAIIKLADLYDVSCDYIMCKIDVEADNLTEKESDIISLYRTLDNDSQNILFGMLHGLSSKNLFDKKK